MKAIVHYRNNGRQRIFGRGFSALVEPIDHPSSLPGQHVTNQKPVYTSPVIRVGSNGEFETENTIYRPTPVFNDDD